MAEILVGALVDADEVREIVDTELTNPRIANFINMAYVTTKNLGMTDTELLKQIQLLLSAHFLTVYEGVVQSQSVGGEYSVSFARVVGEGLKASTYGQQALALDTTGKLAKATLKRATFQVSSYYEMYDSDYLQTLVE